MGLLKFGQNIISMVSCSICVVWRRTGNHCKATAPATHQIGEDKQLQTKLGLDDGADNKATI